MKILVLFDLCRRPPKDMRFSARYLREEEGKPTEADVLSSLRRLGHTVEMMPIYDSVASILDAVTRFAPDLVFNLTESFHANRGHEPNIPALLELLGLPYTGAGADALLLCKDKPLAKMIVAYHGVRVARFAVSPRVRPLRALKNFVYPAFVKPIGEESSDGISQNSFVRDEKEALERADFVHQHQKTDALIEEYIEGRELYLSVLGNRRFTVFPSRELFFGQGASPQFATWRVKWDDDYRRKWKIRNGPPASLPDGVEERLIKTARTVSSALKVRGLCRVDVRLLPSGEVCFLEANPNPSLAAEDDFAKAAAAGGVPYDVLIQRIVDSALDSRVVKPHQPREVRANRGPRRPAVRVRPRLSPRIRGGSPHR